MASATSPIPLCQLSSLSQGEFAAALDGVYEHSPWVAGGAWSKRPFATFAALREALSRSVEDATAEMQLGLIRAHPELAGKAAIEGKLTAASTREQGGVGLDRCSPEEFEQLTRLNQDYRAKFGHPFIIAVRGHTRASVIAEFARRLESTPEQEFEECLRQITRIAELRLHERIADAPPG